MSRVVLGSIVLFSAILLAGGVAPRQAVAQHTIRTKECDGLANVPAAICLDEANKKADVEMNSLLGDIRNVLDDPADRERFDAAEQAWLKYRALTCNAESRVYFGDGSGRATANETCFQVETLSHIADLHEAYDWRVEWVRRNR